VVVGDLFDLKNVSFDRISFCPCNRHDGWRMSSHLLSKARFHTSNVLAAQMQFARELIGAANKNATARGSLHPRDDVPFVVACCSPINKSHAFGTEQTSRQGL